MHNDIFKDIQHKGRFIAQFAAIGIVAAILLIVSVAGSFNDREYVVTVTDKERASNGFDGHDRPKSKYLIFCEDVDGNPLVFEDTDCWMRGKFNSSDMYGRLKVGKTFTVTAVGWRIPMMSRYRNIIKAEEHY